MKRTLGEQETLLLAYTQMRGSRTVRTGELLRPLEITKDQERELFRRLSRGGLIARVRPGLYLVPPRLPLGGAWSPDEILALNTLIEDRKGQYQICGPNAFNRYGFDEQIPTQVYAYNNRISGKRIIGKVELTWNRSWLCKGYRAWRSDPKKRDQGGDHRNAFLSGLQWDWAHCTTR